MTEHEELMIYKAIFDSPHQKSRIDKAKRIYTLNFNVECTRFARGAGIRNAYRIREKLLNHKEYFNEH